MTHLSEAGDEIDGEGNEKGPVQLVVGPVQCRPSGQQVSAQTPPVTA